MGLAPAKGTRPRAEVGRAVEMRQGWPDKAAGEGEAEGRSRGFRSASGRLNFGDRAAPDVSSFAFSPPVSSTSASVCISTEKIGSIITKKVGQARLRYLGELC